MHIEVLYDVVLETKFFLGILPPDLMNDIGRRKGELFADARNAPLSATGHFVEKRIVFSGREYVVTACLGKKYTGDDGEQVQQLWILTVVPADSVEDET